MLDKSLWNAPLASTWWQAFAPALWRPTVTLLMKCHQGLLGIGKRSPANGICNTKPPKPELFQILLPAAVGVASRAEKTKVNSGAKLTLFDSLTAPRRPEGDSKGPGRFGLHCRVFPDKSNQWHWALRSTLSQVSQIRSLQYPTSCKNFPFPSATNCTLRGLWDGQTCPPNHGEV